MSAPSPKTVLAGLLRGAGYPDATLGRVELTGMAPVLPSSFAVDAAAQATIAAAALRITFPMVLVSTHDFGNWAQYLPRNPGFM